MFLQLNVKGNWKGHVGEQNVKMEKSETAMESVAIEDLFVVFKVGRKKG